LEIPIPSLPMTAPAALGMLLLAALIASVGAVIGGGGTQQGERFRTALFGALLALAALLSLDGHWLVAAGTANLLRGAVDVPHEMVWLAPLVTSAGATFGGDPRNSRWMLATAAFLARHSQIAVTGVAVILGGWLGYLVTSGIACLTPFGIIAGIFLGVAVARPTSRLLRRSGGPPRPRVYPSYRRYGP
jgi:hypothetical protein